MNRTMSQLRAEKAEATVRRRGALAFESGDGIESCPYKDHRQDSGKLTWSRHWRKCWMEGYERAKTAKELTR
jgi:hypothetical protein